MKLPPLLQLVVEVVTLRRLVVNRFTIILLVLGLASLAGTLYIDANDDGDISGQVVTESGDPVANVTITLKQVPLGGGVVKTMRTTTDKSGAFTFSNQTRVLEFQIVVTKDGKKLASERYHLFYYGQNKQIKIVAP